LLRIIRIQNLFDKRYLHFQNPLIAPLWEKTNILLEFRAFKRRRNMIVRSFIIQRQQHRRFFPITLSHIFPLPSSTCLPENTAEFRTKKDRRGANENNKEWFFPSRRANPRDHPAAVSAFPALFLVRSDFFTVSYYLCFARRKKSSSALFKGTS